MSDHVKHKLVREPDDTITCAVVGCPLRVGRPAGQADLSRAWDGWPDRWYPTIVGRGWPGLSSVL